MESKIIRVAAIKCTLGQVQLLFEQCVFIAKSVYETTYSDCNTVQTTDCSTVSVQLHLHKALNKPFSYQNALQ
jgi:hypothetical protein